MASTNHGRRHSAGKLAAAVIVAAGTLVGVTRAASAGSLCGITSCIVVPPVPAPGCSIDFGNAHVDGKPTVDWTGPTAHCP